MRFTCVSGTGACRDPQLKDFTALCKLDREAGGPEGR